MAVTDNALTQAVSELRQALGDDPSKPTYVQTVARRGYRFIAPVTVAGAAEHATPADEAQSRALERCRRWACSISPTSAATRRSPGCRPALPRRSPTICARRCSSGSSIARASSKPSAGSAPTWRRCAASCRSTWRWSAASSDRGDRLRITARAVDAASGEALADSKADGLLADVFDLQDRIVAQLSAAIGSRPRCGAATSASRDEQPGGVPGVHRGTGSARHAGREQVARAIEDFERAIGLDPRYAAAHVGLGNARFWQYEMSRARTSPTPRCWRKAIDHVRRAIELERDLAEAHATLAFLLVSAGTGDRGAGRGAARGRAGAGLLGPSLPRRRTPRGGTSGCARWRASWTSTRTFPSRTSKSAMVHIARGTSDRAESVLREGTIVQDRQAHLRQRYPARGLHWLLGLVRLAQGDVAEADGGVRQGARLRRRSALRPEFMMNACDGGGFAQLRAGDPAAAVGISSRPSSSIPSTPARSSVWAWRSRAGKKRRKPTRYSRAPTRRSMRCARADAAARRRSPRPF